MKERFLRRIIAALLFLCMPVVCASAETVAAPFLYCDIPFENVAQSQIAENGTVIDFYGYSMELLVDFIPNRSAISRILLSDAAEPFADEAGFRQMTFQDVEMFIDLDEELTKLYGEPDYRFFICGEKGRLQRNERFMFEDGQWSAEGLMNVFHQEERTFRAWTVWNNVQLELWVRGFRRTESGFSNLLTVSYFPNAQEYDITLVDYLPIN